MILSAGWKASSGSGCTCTRSRCLKASGWNWSGLQISKPSLWRLQMRGRTSSARIRLFNPTQQTPNIASFCLFSFFRLSLRFQLSLAPIPLVLFAFRHSCQSHLHITRPKNWSTSSTSHPHTVSSQLPCQDLFNVSFVSGCCVRKPDPVPLILTDLCFRS